MSWVAVGVAGVTAAVKIGQGVKQRRMAKKLKQSNYVSPELKKAEAEANMNVNAAEYTGQSQDQANIRQSTSRSISNASKVAGGANELLNFAGAAQGNENAGMREVARRAMIWRDQWKRERNQVRSRIATRQDRNRDEYNAAKSALLGAGNQNIWSGITGGLAAGGAAYTGAQSGGGGSGGQAGGQYYGNMPTYGTPKV